MITITINPQTGEQIRIMAAAMIELLKTPPAEAATAEPTPAEPAKRTKKAATPAQAATESAQAAAAPTLEEVRAVLKTYKDAGKSVKALLATVDAPHLLSVPPERYSELLANMEKM